MKKIIIIASVLLLVIVVVARLYFSTISKSSRYIEKSLKSIPADASIIFEFTNDQGFYEIFSSYTVFDDIIGEAKKEELRFIKNQLSNNPKFARITEAQNLYLSLHHEGADSISFLWIMPLKENLTMGDYFTLLKDTDSTLYEVNKQNKGISVKVISKKNNSIFYLDISDGVAKGSYSKSLLQSCLDTKKPKISKEFLSRLTASYLKNDNSPLNVFLNLNAGGTFINSLYKSRDTRGFFTNYSANGFASLNMNYKSDALVFSGLVNPDTTKTMYQNIFLHQKPVVHTIERIVPENTSNFTAYGLSDYKIFRKDVRGLLNKESHLNQIKEVFKKITQETGIDLDTETNGIWSNEFISLQLSTQEQLGCIKLTNGEKLTNVFEPLSSQYSPSIRKLNYPDILYGYFGQPFKSYIKPYYTVIDNYLIFSNSAGSVQRFLTNYNTDRVLFKTPSYIQFSKSVADMSNMFVFIHNYNSKSYYKTDFKEPIYDLLNKSNNVGLNKFYGFSCQLTSNSTYFFTNIFSEYRQNFTLQEDEKQVGDTIKSVADIQE